MSTAHSSKLLEHTLQINGNESWLLMNHGGHWLSYSKVWLSQENNESFKIQCRYLVTVDIVQLR